MPAENTDLYLELVRNAPAILEAAAKVVVGIVSLVGGLASMISVYYAARAKVAAELSVRRTDEGNEAIKAVHEAVKQAPPAVAVTVEAPPAAPTTPTES